MKYKYKKGDEELEEELTPKDFFLITAIDNLTHEIKKTRLARGR